jgi:hypothetical protein
VTRSQITFANYRSKPQKHEVVGSLNFKLKDVTANPNHFAPAIWFGSLCALNLVSPLNHVIRYHLYGSPVMPSTEIKPSVLATTNSMNMGAREGVEYKGRVLLALQHRLSEDIQKQTNTQSSGKGTSKHLLSKKGQHKLSKETKDYWMQTGGTSQTSRLRITIHEGHELLGDNDGKCFVSVAFGQAGSSRPYDSSENVFRTDVVDVTKGVHQFYQSGAIQDIDATHFLTRPGEDPLDNAPDIFCYVYEKLKMGSRRLGYVRLNAKDNKGAANPPKWYRVTRDPYSDDATFTGYLLMDVSVESPEKIGAARKSAAIKPPTMRHFVLVTQVYLARGLPAADSNGLSDPFVEVHLGGLCQKTDPIYNTLNPSWYRTIMCDVEIPEEKSLRRQITCILRDANQGAEKVFENAAALIGVKVTNTLLGRCEIPIDGVTSKLQSPKWYELYDPSTGIKGEGRILLGFQLINREDFDDSKINRDIRPVYEPSCTLHICALGCRSLSSYGFRPINNSLVEMDCVDAEAKTHLVKSRNSSQPTGSDPNFCQILKMKLALPRDANFAPVLTVRTIDHRFYGASKPTVGSCSISLDAQVFALFNERDSSVGVDPLFKASVQDEDAEVAKTLDKMTPEQIDKLYQEMEEKKQSKAAKIAAGLPVIDEDDVAQELAREPTDDGTAAIESESEVAVTMGPVISVPGEDVVMSDDENAPEDQPHYMKVNGRQRNELKTSLDNTTGAPPFDSFVLMRGRAKGRGFLSRLLKVDAPAHVGTFKASVVLTRSKEHVSPAVLAKAMSLIPKQADLTPRQLVVRVYVLKGFRLFNGDSGGGSEMHTYVKVGLGANVISRRDFSEKGNDNVEYYQAFEIAANLPGIALLNISIMEKNLFGFDSLLGTGIIDLENRWFSKTWKALQPKPIEQIALRLPTSRLPQGKVSLWVDILSNAESTSHPPYDISRPPKIKFEIRLVLWRAKDMTCR